MSHHTYTATQPTYWLAFDGTTVEKGNYGYLYTDFVLDTDQDQLETFATANMSPLLAGISPNAGHQVSS